MINYDELEGAELEMAAHDLKLSPDGLFVYVDRWFESKVEHKEMWLISHKEFPHDSRWNPSEDLNHTVEIAANNSIFGDYNVGHNIGVSSGTLNGESGIRACVFIEAKDWNGKVLYGAGKNLATALLRAFCKAAAIIREREKNEVKD